MTLEIKLERQMKKTKINLDNFDRKFTYDNFKDFENPFVTIVCEVDITNLVNYTKEHKNFYHSMNYLVMKAMNNVYNFGYRIVDNEVYHCQDVGVGLVGLNENNNIYFYHGLYTDTLEKFLKQTEENKQLALKGINNQTEETLMEIYTSCFPWRKMKALDVPVTKKQYNPQVIWDKFETKDGKSTINLFVYAHHSFCDGLHLAQFFDEFEKLEKNFPNI